MSPDRRPSKEERCGPSACVGAAWRTVGAAHIVPASACTAAVARQAADDLVTGEKKLRSLLTRTREWSDPACRLGLVRRCFRCR